MSISNFIYSFLWTYAFSFSLLCPFNRCQLDYLLSAWFLNNSLDLYGGLMETHIHFTCICTLHMHVYYIQTYVESQHNKKRKGKQLKPLWEALPATLCSWRPTILGSIKSPSFNVLLFYICGCKGNKTITKEMMKFLHMIFVCNLHCFLKVLLFILHFPSFSYPVWIACGVTLNITLKCVKQFYIRYFI